MTRYFRMPAFSSTVEAAGVSEGITFIISSHILGELSKFASRYGIIHNGALLQELSGEENFPTGFFPVSARPTISRSFRSVSLPLTPTWMNPLTGWILRESQR